MFNGEATFTILGMFAVLFLIVLLSMGGNKNKSMKGKKNLENVSKKITEETQE